MKTVPTPLHQNAIRIPNSVSNARKICTVRNSKDKEPAIMALAKQSVLMTLNVTLDSNATPASALNAHRTSTAILKGLMHVSWMNVFNVVLTLLAKVQANPGAITHPVVNRARVINSVLIFLRLLSVRLRLQGFALNAKIIRTAPLETSVTIILVFLILTSKHLFKRNQLVASL